MTDDSLTPWSALIEFQKECPAVIPNDLGHALTILKPLLTKHGLFVVQSIEMMDGTSEWIVTTTLLDVNHREKYESGIRLGPVEEESRLQGLAYMFGFAIGEPPAQEPPKEFVAQPDVAHPMAVPAEVWMHLAEEMKTKIGIITNRDALDDWYAANKTVVHIMENAPQGKEAHAVVEEVFKAKWRETAA